MGPPLVTPGIAGGIPLLLLGSQHDGPGSSPKFDMVLENSVVQGSTSIRGETESVIDRASAMFEVHMLGIHMLFGNDRFRLESECLEEAQASVEVNSSSKLGSCW